MGRCKRCLFSYGEAQAVVYVWVKVIGGRLAESFKRALTRVHRLGGGCTDSKTVRALDYYLDRRWLVEVMCADYEEAIWGHLATAFNEKRHSKRSKREILQTSEHVRQTRNSM